MRDLFDKQGQRITFEEWSATYRAGRSLQVTTVGAFKVSTIWLGINHNFTRDGPPIIFETMIHDGKEWDQQWRYETLEQAEAGHASIVMQLRNGTTPDEVQL